MNAEAKVSVYEISQVKEFLCVQQGASSIARAWTKEGGMGLTVRTKKGDSSSACGT